MAWVFLLVPQVKAAECEVGKKDCSELTIVDAAADTCKFSRTSTTVKKGENPWNFNYTHELYWFADAANSGAAAYKSTVDASCFITSKVGTKFGDDGTPCKRFAAVSFNSSLAPVEDPATFSGTCSTTVGGLPGTTICCPRTVCPPGQDPKDDKGNSGEYQSGEEDFSMEFDSLFSFTNKTITYTVTNNSPESLDFDWAGLRVFGVADFSGTVAPGEMASIAVPGSGSREKFVELRCVFNDAGDTEIAANVATQIPESTIPTVSEWGLIVMTLLGMTALAVLFGRRRRSAA